MSRSPHPWRWRAAGASLGRTLLAVAWGFFGVRGKDGAREDRKRVSPLGVLGVGLVAVLALVLCLALIAKYMASR